MFKLKISAQAMQMSIKGKLWYTVITLINAPAKINIWPARENNCRHKYNKFEHIESELK